jgi:hypothetical protein
VQGHQGEHRQGREAEEADLVGTGHLLGHAQAGGQVEAADAAGHADQAGHDADLLAEPLGRQLEHRAVAGAQGQHREHQHRQGDPGRGHLEAGGRQAQGGQGEDDGQGPHPAEAVGQGPADRTDERSGEHAGGGEEAGDHRGQAVFGVEVDGQGRGQADEAAEGHRVEQHQPPGVRNLQHVHILGQLLGRGLLGRVLGQQHVDDEGDGQGNGGQADHVLPAEGLGQDRREQGGQGGAGVAGPGDAQGQALMLLRIPARGQRQGDGERGAGHAQHQAQGQHLM